MSLSKFFQPGELDMVGKNVDSHNVTSRQHQAWQHQATSTIRNTSAFADVTFADVTFTDAAQNSTNSVAGILRSKRSLKQLALHQFKIFEAAARYCSFTRAAKELYVTQPTVSMQVKQLADVVGMPLFEQTGKRISLTVAGEELLETCYELFEKLAEFETRIADLKDMKRGHLKIAAISPINTLIVRLLNPFCRRYPGINISVDVMNSEQILKRLSENTHDLYLMCEAPIEPGIYSQPFVRNSLAVVASVHHPLATAGQIPLSRLHGEPFIVREAGSATRRAVQTVLDQHGVAVKVQLEVGNNEAIKQMLMYGLGISVLSADMVATEVEKGLLTILNVGGFPIDRTWYAAYPSSKQLSPVASTFLKFIQHQASADALAA